MCPTTAMSTEHELRAVRALLNSPLVLLSRRHRCAAPLPALPAPGSAWKAPGAPAPSQPNTFRLISQAQLARECSHVAVLPRLRLSNSRPPRQWRPPGVARTGLRPAIDPAAAHTDLGACGKDGQEQVPATGPELPERRRRGRRGHLRPCK